jgi:hypothetical protein
MGRLACRRGVFENYGLAFVAMEEIILVAAAALGALQAAHQKYCHTHRDQHGENAFVRRKPMRYGLHFRSPFPKRSGPFAEIQAAQR